jgi:hypothetical protein
MSNEVDSRKIRIRSDFDRGLIVFLFIAAIILIHSLLR